jgi:hypothetical protein
MPRGIGCPAAFSWARPQKKIHQDATGALSFS